MPAVAAPNPMMHLMRGHIINPDMCAAPAQRFLEGLLEAYTSAVEERQADRAVLLAAAAAELLKAHALLAEHAVALGHVDKLLRMLQTNVPPAEGGRFQPCQSASDCTVRGD